MSTDPSQTNTILIIIFGRKLFQLVTFQARCRAFFVGFSFRRHQRKSNVEKNAFQNMYVCFGILSAEHIRCGQMTKG